LTVAARTVTDEGWSDEVWSGTLLIGDRNAERGGRYVMIEGYDAVLFDTQGDYSFLNVRLSQLRSRLIWLHSIDNVSSVRYDLDGVTRTLRISHPENDDETIQGWLDDVELNVTNTRRLYVGSLMINQDGETSEPIPTDILPQYRITMNFIDGGSEMLELFQISESQFLITHNGISTGFFMTRMALQQGLLDRFDIIDAGGEIPM
ncbi:MAG: hypothetical protein LBD23_01570, partial [Oscillospiraceae bacterium]|nr:hypothetical protein [Oscillospiraceae bacterium]